MVCSDEGQSYRSSMHVRAFWCTVTKQECNRTLSSSFLRDQKNLDILVFSERLYGMASILQLLTLLEVALIWSLFIHCLPCPYRTNERGEFHGLSTPTRRPLVHQ